ncbi:MAG: hypothetical protein ACRYFR_05705 [Janthinobacterium lividum]
MLRLDKTATRKTTLHADHSAKDAPRWQTMTAEEKQEVPVYLRWQAKSLRAIREVCRQQDRDKGAGQSANGEPTT